MNVIVICMDTLRRDALGCFGNRRIRTPAMDAFAARATCFDRAYCGSFPTVPMRTDAFTGNCNWPRYGWKPLGDEEITVTQCLREAGYQTGLMLDTSNMVPAKFPRDFHEYDLIGPPPENKVKPNDIEMPFPAENVRQGGGGYRRDMARMSHMRHEIDWFVARTMIRAGGWLEDNFASQPFFLWVDTFEIHEIWRAPDYYTRLYSPGPFEGHDYCFPNYGYTDIYTQAELERLQARYAAEVTLTDKWVDVLLRQIEEMGLLDSTMVMLVSDHGMYLGEHNRMGKHTVREDDPWPLYEEVAGIPLIVWLPGGKRPKRSNALVQAADIAPTILDAAGAEGPTMYGRSVLPVLTGEAREVWDLVFTSRHCGSGPGPSANRPSHITATGPRYSLVVGPEPFEAELFDLQKDPGQQHNCIKKHPRIAKQMHAALVDFMREGGSDEEYIRGYARL
ncbi:MAG: sulfatase [Armatimonadota bacterium]